MKKSMGNGFPGKKIVNCSGSIRIQQKVAEENTETENENVRADVSRKLEIKVNQLLEENKKLISYLEHKTKDWQFAEEKARMYESRAADLNAKYNAANAKEAGDDLCDVHTELELLRKQMNEAHKRLQDETRDEAKLQQSLQELSEQHGEQMRYNRAEINSMNSRISKLETTNAALNGRIYDLEQFLQKERTRHVADIAYMGAELQRCHDEIAQQLHEYQDLMDIKDSLDFEVPAYDNLLCDETDISQTEYFITSSNDIEVSKCEPKVTVQNKGTTEVQIDGSCVKCKSRSLEIDGGTPVSQWYVASAIYEPQTKIMMKPRKWKSGENIMTTMFNEEEFAGADRVKRTIIRHVSSNRIINEEGFSDEKYPLQRKWIYHVFHRRKISPHPSWLLKVLGAIT
ncbi:lamin-C-like [Musca autumnalis]|uniref:lamin-C-like n=1 Tax=Musca autumnalis TaxID=221902 RepID=UPI003CF5BAFA